jgi:hypothetical protein
MDYTHWTIEQFKALPEPSSFTNEEIGLIEGLIIMPTNNLHESGYRLMEFVTIQDGVPTYRVSGCSDVLHIGGIGGYNIGRYNFDNMDMLIHREMMPRIAWKIDCLPISGLVRLFCGKKMYLGESLSEMGIFVIEDKTNGEV